MSQKFEMVAKTLKGLEDVLAEELRNLGAENVEPGCRMVSFEGDLAMMYRANICCRTALSILRPIYKFMASDPDTLYEMVKEYDWGNILTLGKTFSIDTTTHSNEFTHSRFVTYRVKDAIVDWFKDRYGADKRPGVRLNDADVMINVHIDGTRITLSLNSSGESLHKRGWRVAQTDAPINEVLAAGIILKSGWRGETPFVDPMCGSGTFLIEAAMIAAGIKPGSYRDTWPFATWRDWDPELFESVLHEGDDELREIPFKIYGTDISPKAIDIAERNILSAGVDEYINLRVRPLQHWDEAPADGIPGVLVTNPPYGERLKSEDIENLYRTLGTKLKKVFCGYHSWVISSNEDCLACIGLTPSLREQLQNGGLDCELREYISFEGTKSEFRASGGTIKGDRPAKSEKSRYNRKSDSEWTRDARSKGMGGKRGDRQQGPRRGLPKDNALSEKYRPKKGGYARNEERRRKFKEETARMGERYDSMQRSEAEELLSRRRNIHALKSLGETPKMPSIPASEGPFMRTRRRWKRPDTEGNNNE